MSDFHPESWNPMCELEPKLLYPEFYIMRKAFFIDYTDGQQSYHSGSVNTSAAESNVWRRHLLLSIVRTQHSGNCSRSMWRCIISNNFLSSKFRNSNQLSRQKKKIQADCSFLVFQRWLDEARNLNNSASPDINPLIRPVVLISQFPNRSPESGTFFSQILNRPKSNRAEHKMIEYLNPLQLFRQSMKRTYYMPSAVFIGVCFTDEFASVAISNSCYFNTRIYGIYPRDDVQSLLDELVDEIQILKNDYEYDVEGIIVANNSSLAPPVDIHNLMEDIRKKLNFESLKYTCWKDNITPWRPGFMFNRSGICLYGIKFPGECYSMTTPKELLERVEEFSALHMLQAFLNVFNTLHMERDEESMGRDKECVGRDKEREEKDEEWVCNVEERECKDGEREYSKRKVTRRGRVKTRRGRKKDEEREEKGKEEREEKRLGEGVFQEKKWCKIIQ
ncbi:hypothetical protein LWI29_026457 [Acer saccharum]|uniref:Uncharacterized protein n=1 Tax=Acer saccharum TaxID=4024 RepID=A0AA39W0G3_ACESA|nr:hypothetical protein LWI29_026457 [Acer saccharum]